MKALVRVSALLILAGPASAQVPAGSVLAVSTATTLFHFVPDVTVNSAGEFVIVWSGQDLDGSDDGMAARRFHADGSSRGGEFLVNLTTFQNQDSPSAVLDRHDRLTVAWNAQTGSSTRATGRRFGPANDGGAEFAISASSVLNYVTAKGMAIAPQGDFVVTWADRRNDYPDSNIYARRYARSGQPVGGEFTVNSYTTHRQYDAAVAMDGLGAFVVVWNSLSADGGHSGIFGQRFDAAGARLGGEFRVSAATSDIEAQPAIAVAPHGSFAVAWEASNPSPAAAVHTVARLFAASGAAMGSEFQVHGGATAESDRLPGLAMDESGAFTVAWESIPDGLLEGSIKARRFGPDGQARGATFTVADLPAYELWPEIAGDPAGNFVVVWAEGGPGHPTSDILAQRFGGLQPAALAVDTVAGPHANGNGILEPNENIDVRTTWRNVNGAAQTFAGTLAVERPGEPSPAPRPFPYFVEDGAGDYGTAASGAPRECTDCYSVRTFTEPEPPAPSPSPWLRPPGHVDGAVWETITPDAQGQHKKWLLHLGATFTDVLVAGPFYRFIETLVHNGVTTGCTTTTYCPTQAVTREQMAVFVLTAEDRDAGPPLCTTPRFDDVPAGSPFCRWVEELARRGVTAGCTPTSYCPGDSVTREQMAVFVLRTFDPNLSPPACTTPIFSDLPASSPYCRWVEELVRRGVVAGCGGGRYCGADPVTREQMAVYLTRTFGLRLYGP